MQGTRVKGMAKWRAFPSIKHARAAATTAPAEAQDACVRLLAAYTPIGHSV